MKPERRTISLKTANLRVKRNEDGSATVGGHAAVFDRWSENLGGFVEKIAPGAFKAALKGADVRALKNHDANLILGRTSAGTLRLKEDKEGLYMEYDSPDVSYARDLLVSIERGDITGQSFGFTVTGQAWEDEDKDLAKRTITEIGELYDVGPVTFPAYPDTDVAVRALDELRKANDAAIRDEQRAATCSYMDKVFLFRKRQLQSKGL
jgi:HK97 family phage prohead protease